MVEKNCLIEKIVANYLYDGARFTTDELAKELHISKRTLYEIFGNKDNLIRDCANYIINQYDKIVPKNGTISDVDFMKMILPIKYPSHFISLSKYNRFFADVKKIYPDIYSEIFLNFNNRMRELLVQYFVIGMDRGLIRTEINPDLFIDILENESRIFNERFRKYMVSDILYTFIIAVFRGLCTEKGGQLLDDIVMKYETDMIKNIEIQMEKCK